LDRRLDGPQSRSGCGGEEKNSQPLPGQEPPLIQTVAQSHTIDILQNYFHPLYDIYYKLKKESFWGEGTYSPLSWVTIHGNTHLRIIIIRKQISEKFLYIYNNFEENISFYMLFHQGRLN
jgi:hypothetical protein